MNRLYKLEASTARGRRLPEIIDLDAENAFLDDPLGKPTFLSLFYMGV